MAETNKKTLFEAETFLPAKIKPAHKIARKPVRHEEEHTLLVPVNASDVDRKQVILRIIDFFKANE
jgi:hypothetical protein